MRKKVLYTLKFSLDEYGTPSIQEIWGTYDDAEVEEKFHGLQLEVLARKFAEAKNPCHFRKILRVFLAKLKKREEQC